MPDTQNHPSIDIQILEYLSTQPTSEIRGIVANVHANM